MLYYIMSECEHARGLSNIIVSGLYLAFIPFPCPCKVCYREECEHHLRSTLPRESWSLLGVFFCRVNQRRDSIFIVSGWSTPTTSSGLLVLHIVDLSVQDASNFHYGVLTKLGGLLHLLLKCYIMYNHLNHW